MEADFIYDVFIFAKKKKMKELYSYAIAVSWISSKRIDEHDRGIHQRTAKNYQNKKFSLNLILDGLTAVDFDGIKERETEKQKSEKKFQENKTSKRIKHVNLKVDRICEQWGWKHWE